MKALVLLISFVVVGCSDLMVTQDIYPNVEYIDYECKHPVIHKELIRQEETQAFDGVNYYKLKLPSDWDFAPFTYTMESGSCTYTQKQSIGHEIYYYLEVM
jgi:hypothetical protein